MVKIITVKQGLEEQTVYSDGDTNCPGGQCLLPDGSCAEPGKQLCKRNIYGDWMWHRCENGKWVDTGNPCSGTRGQLQASQYVVDDDPQPNP